MVDIPTCPECDSPLILPSQLNKDFVMRCSNLDCSSNSEQVKELKIEGFPVFASDTPSDTPNRSILLNPKNIEFRQLLPDKFIEIPESVNLKTSADFVMDFKTGKIKCPERDPLARMKYHKRKFKRLRNFYNRYINRSLKCSDCGLDVSKHSSDTEDFFYKTFEAMIVQPPKWSAKDDS